MQILEGNVCNYLRLKTGESHGCAVSGDNNRSIRLQAY